MIRLHILGIPHTITTNEYSHCAFTGKVYRFPRMMMSRGFEVFHYGVEGSNPGATREITLMTQDEWNTLRSHSLKQLHPELTYEEIKEKLSNPKEFIGSLANWGTPLYRVFNERLRDQLKLNYRSPQSDIVCLPFGRSHDLALENGNYAIVESGIGYPDSYRDFRIFESYCWLHTTLGKEKRNGQNYWFVVPNYFDSAEWPLSLNPDKKKVGFLGRIYEGKGCDIILEIAKRMTNVDFVLCGQGDPSPFLKAPNIQYKEPIHGTSRAEYLGSLCCLLTPTKFVEPFCGVNVEAQLCGTPVISANWGAQTETIENFKTGLLCHTLQDYCQGIQMAIDGKFDREYIRKRAVEKYDMYNVAKQYEYVFKTINDVFNGSNGWYSKETYVEGMNSHFK